MKRILSLLSIILVLLFSVCAFSACDDDDEGQKPTDPPTLDDPPDKPDPPDTPVDPPEGYADWGKVTSNKNYTLIFDQYKIFFVEGNVAIDSNGYIIEQEAWKAASFTGAPIEFIWDLSDADETAMTDCGNGKGENVEYYITIYINDKQKLSDKQLTVADYITLNTTNARYDGRAGSLDGVKYTSNTSHTARYKFTGDEVVQTVTSKTISLKFDLGGLITYGGHTITSKTELDSFNALLAAAQNGDNSAGDGYTVKIIAEIIDNRPEQTAD